MLWIVNEFIYWKEFVRMVIDMCVRVRIEDLELVDIRVFIIWLIFKRKGWFRSVNKINGESVVIIVMNFIF